jgi:hypothetical protein
MGLQPATCYWTYALAAGRCCIRPEEWVVAVPVPKTSSKSLPTCGCCQHQCKLEEQEIKRWRKTPQKETKEQNDVGRKEAPKCHTQLLKLTKLQSTTTSELASKSANQSNQQKLPSFWKPLKQSTNFFKRRKSYTRGNNTRETKTKDKNHDKNYGIEMRIKQGKEQSAAPEIENAHILLLLRRRRKTKQEKFQTEGAEEQLLLPGKS